MPDELGPGWADRIVWRGESVDHRRPGARQRPLKAKTLGQFTDTMKRGNEAARISREIDRALDAVMPEVDE